MSKTTKNKSSTSIEIETNRDELAVDLVNVINKSMKSQGDVAFFLDDVEDPSQITDWISTGNDGLDLIISNRKNGGFPVGRIVEVTGLEGSGKSLLCATALKNTQKKGGVAVFIDTENAVSQEYLYAIGVSPDSLVCVHLETVEDIFDTVEKIIERVRSTNDKRIVTIVIDSIAAATTKTELEQDHGAAGFATQKAIAISKAMRKITNLIGKQRILLICTNQLRQKVGVMQMPGSDPWTTSGGKALAFHASLRLRLSPVGKIKGKDGLPCGVKTKALVVKNRMGPPFRSTEFNIFFDRGVDNYGNWAEILFDAGILSAGKIEKFHPDGKKKTKIELETEKEKLKGSKMYQFDLLNEDGTIKETISFEKSKLPSLLVERSDVKEYLYDQYSKLKIFQYQNADDSISSDDFTIESASSIED